MEPLTVGNIVFDRDNRYQTGTSSGVKGHICNCITCCLDCGQCRTAPWHTERVCKEVAKLKKKIGKIIGEETSKVYKVPEVR